MAHLLNFLFGTSNTEDVDPEPEVISNEEYKGPDIEINDEKKRVFDEIVNSNNNYLILGKAGTGKSTLLKYLRAYTKKANVTVAPTGIAALVVEAQTIHSMFRIPPKLFVKNDDLLKPLVQKQRLLLRSIEMLIIDEISMVRSDLIDAIDIRMKEVKENELPFGGVQVVMFGDLFQLPPVVTDKGAERYLNDTYGSRFFFDGAVWMDTDMTVIELQESFRQKDKDFVRVLDKIRKGDIDNDVLEKINTRYITKLPENESIIVLTTINQTVTMVNNKSLASLPEEEVVFTARISGKIREASFPTESRLRLKIGAQVMLLKNDINKKYVNGTVGTVTGFESDSAGNDIVLVEVDGVSHPIGRRTWSKHKYVYNEVTKKIFTEPISTFIQFPLRLAWAITIHKSQGQTLDESVLVDLSSGTFEGGQAYVALSRISDFNKLYLSAPVRIEDFKINSEVAIFLDKYNIRSVSDERLQNEELRYDYNDQSFRNQSKSEQDVTQLLPNQNDDKARENNKEFEVQKWARESEKWVRVEDPDEIER